MKKTLFIIIFGILIVFPVAIKAEIKSPIIAFYDFKTMQEIRRFYPFSQEQKIFNFSYDLADINNDGYFEIIVGSGKDMEPKIKIFSYNGTFIKDFGVLAPENINGFDVKVTDYDQDQQPEIMVQPNAGSLPQLSFYDLNGIKEWDLLAFDKTYSGGVSATVGDVTNDGKNEIITANGEGYEPIIKIFNLKGETLYQFKTFSNYRYGLNLNLTDLNSDGYNDIVIAPKIGYGPVVRIYDHLGTQMKEFNAFGTNFTGGVNFDLANVNGGNYIEFIAGTGFSGDSKITFTSLNGNTVGIPDLYTYSDFKGGIVPKVYKDILAVSTQYIPKSEYTKNYKMIEVDLRTQRLRTYFRSEFIRELKTSTGTYKHPTPQGTYNIRSKIPSGTMSWNYGPNNPDNYNLKNVPWILPFYGSYTIHGAYWHNNFGWRMSHGCVNLSVKDSKWMYDWADVGLPVHIYSSPKK